MDYRDVDKAALKEGLQKAYHPPQDQPEVLTALLSRIAQLDDGRDAKPGESRYS
ncbi:hypothetical protein OG2516_02039 [Oceanicola granulosus HTCC2516]|uniref:Uncharacterized protein n=1 Tax=Oceanicola granulosus (strain ATCC BAA-861 / DSM 15982 / KCTC 12143 / HTCC2516) TaxID=314256 RepID=Q2CHW6_OCEGH|nr:hypothetical protein OG2516_02039 [Oceanicola granulosus HTCC2516]